MIAVGLILSLLDISNYLVAHGVTFVKYASILLQSLTIMLDEDFLMEILDMTKTKGAWGGMDEEYVTLIGMLKKFSFPVQHSDQGCFDNSGTYKKFDSRTRGLL